MKKVFCVICCVVFLFPLLYGCGKSGDNVLIDAGLQAAGRMKEMVCCDEYRNIVSPTVLPEGYNSYVDVIKKQDTSKADVYELTVDVESALNQVFTSDYEGQNLDKLPDNLKDRICKMAYVSLVSSINIKNSDYDYSLIAFTNVYNDGGSMIYKTLDKTRFFIYVFDDGFPVIVRFTPEEDDIVNYTSSYLYADCKNIKDSQTLLSETGFDTIPDTKAVKIR